MNVLALNNRVRFTLKSKMLDSIEIDEPIGWDTDDKEYVRNDPYHGIFINMSNSLTFVGNAADYIETVKKTEGIIAELRLTREERHPKTDYWEQSYSGYLDMTTYQKEYGKIKMKFNSGGIEVILKARENEKVEIERTDTIDGNMLVPVKTEDVYLEGRRIFLETTWKTAPMGYHKIFKLESSGDINNTLPMDLFKISHEQAQNTAINLDVYNINNAQETSMLLVNVSRKMVVEVSTKNIRINIGKIGSNAGHLGDVRISIAKYYFDGTYKRISDSVVDLWKSESDFSNAPNNTITIPNESHVFSLEKGESLGLIISLFAFASTYFEYKLLEKGTITIREDSEFPESTIKAVKPFHLANRLIEIITNRKDMVKSDLLQSGKWKDLLLTHGFWIRNFSKQMDASLPEDERKFKPLTTSFRDFMNSFFAVANVGLGIERNGYSERIVIEDLSYFYNQNVTIKLPNPVKNVKRSIDSNKYFQSIEIGYEKGGEYEEAMGLDEFNVKNNYTTIINNVKNNYSQVSPYRADSYGVEFARRKPFNEYSTEDTSYDQDIFFLDCREAFHFYKTRKYSDDFNSTPTGIFSPETAFNLRLSPFNSMLRHGWVINAGLTLYPYDKVKYSSSNGNSTLKTLYPENGEIHNSKLQTARYIPEIVEFSHEVNFDISQKLLGKTRILNKLIPNMYGLVEFINEDGKPERGFLLSLKPNGEGKWKLLKSNR